MNSTKNVLNHNYVLTNQSTRLNNNEVLSPPMNMHNNHSTYSFKNLESQRASTWKRKPSFVVRNSQLTFNKLLNNEQGQNMNIVSNLREIINNLGSVLLII